MNEHLTSRRKAEIDNATPRHKLMTYWGYKFENLCTVSVQPSEITSSDHPELLSRKSSVVNNNVQYCSVAKAALGKNKIIIGAEVDCLSDVKPEKGGNPIDKYIELKTSKVMTRDKDKINFEKYKLIKYWTQSFLIGIPRIIVGFRDDNGFVKHLKEYKTLEIPRMVRGKRNMWDANVCLNFANNFLSWLRTVIVEDDPRASYLIRFKEPFREIEVIFMGCNGTAAVNERFLGVL
ncbi:3384_t:CDS:2 [Paraglomus occultum]|uniref:Decapping nuclease n=1 Tax=Paraglomus occultum TaxID=144539 RepID=A0A9N8ZCW5_9GLOM|nr:3384_t:CDS:2 [Paraglomus occultum]